MARRRSNDEALPLSDSFRAAWDNLRSDYSAGTTNRFRPQPTGVSSGGSGADYHYRNETHYLRMIERSRYFDRNNMVVAQGVNRLCANILQDGFTNNIETGDKGIDAELAARWLEWSISEDACDLEGEKNWGEIERLALRSTVVDGDVIALPNRDGALQLIENHRLRTPTNTTKNVIHGILLDDRPNSFGRRLQYWLTREDLNPNTTLSRVSDIVKYDARDFDGFRQVLHIYNPNRISQRRGVTAFAPAVDVVGMHDDLQFAHLVKAQVASCFAIFEEYQLGVPRASNTQTGSQSTESMADGSTRVVEGLAPGMRVKGTPGMKLQGFSPNIPNPEFFPHATLLLTFIAINLDLPVAVLLLDPRQTNFSGWRGAIDQARMRFKVIQRWLIGKLHRPVYTWKVRQWIAEDPALRRAAERLGKEIFTHVWNPPTWRYIEPMKDAAADDLRVSRNLISQRRRAAEQGYDWDVLRSEIVADRVAVVREALTAAKKVNSEFPEAKLDWRELAYGHQTSGIKYTFGSSLEDGETAKSGSDASDDSDSEADNETDGNGRQVLALTTTNRLTGINGNGQSH
jgi:lambda family phage portal protein